MNVVSFPQRIRLVEWQTLAAERMAPLYAEETERWQRLLEWDMTARWQEIERRRRQGLASGIVAMDDATNIHGWCHFGVRERALRIEAFVADNDDIAQMMLDRLLSAPALTFIERVSAFLFTDHHSLAQALRARGLAVDRYWYLGRELNTVAPPALQGLRRWRIEDSLATAALFGRAYESQIATRPFAPLGTQEQWFGYINELTCGAYGTILPEASVCLTAGPDKLTAVAIVTRVGESTAHLAQLAVDPQMRRKRLGMQLMEMVSAAAARVGCRRLTVIVAGVNRPARSMFENEARFRAMGSFLAAGTLAPQRATRPLARGRALVTRR